MCVSVCVCVEKTGTKLQLAPSFLPLHLTHRSTLLSLSTAMHPLPRLAAALLLLSAFSSAALALRQTPLGLVQPFAEGALEAVVEVGSDTTFRFGVRESGQASAVGPAGNGAGGGGGGKRGREEREERNEKE